MMNGIEYLHDKWKQLTAFSIKEELKNTLWQEIVYLYSRPNRFYHNLNHLCNLFHLFDKYIDLAGNCALLGFAIFYHDVVYDTLRADNEEQSAAKAKEHLQQLKLTPAFVNNVADLIIATKNHTVDPAFAFKKDMALFLDLDMAVLADDWKDYEIYRASIRKEFMQYPDAVFKSGRKHALQKILDKKAIYYSPDLNNIFEAKARQNLYREISLLTNS